MFSFFRIEDLCRIVSDIGLIFGYCVYIMNYVLVMDEVLEIMMCGFVMGINVGVYIKDFVDISSADWTYNIISANGNIIFIFILWIDGLVMYEVCFEYFLVFIKKNVMFDVICIFVNVNIGLFEFYSSTASDSYGFVGFEFSVFSVEVVVMVLFIMLFIGIGDLMVVNFVFILFIVVFIYVKNYA